MQAQAGAGRQYSTDSFVSVMVATRILRETGGGAIAVDDADLEREAGVGTREDGVDLSPEGGAALAAAGALRASGDLSPEDSVVAFNTGAGWLYRDRGDLPPV